MSSNIKMTDRIMGPPQVMMRTKMVVKMRMLENSQIIPPPLLTMDKAEQGHSQVLIRTWRLPRT
jgi:hypothetical protein